MFDILNFHEMMLLLLYNYYYICCFCCTDCVVLGGGGMDCAAGTECRNDDESLHLRRGRGEAQRRSNDADRSASITPGDAIGDSGRRSRTPHSAAVSGCTTAAADGSRRAIAGSATPVPPAAASEGRWHQNTGDASGGEEDAVGFGCRRERSTSAAVRAASAYAQNGTVSSTPCRRTASRGGAYSCTTPGLPSAASTASPLSTIQARVIVMVNSSLTIITQRCLVVRLNLEFF